MIHYAYIFSTAPIGQFKLHSTLLILLSSHEVQ